MNISRRSFIAGCGSALGVLGFSGKKTSAGSFVRMLQSPIGARTLVLINLEGGYDALGMLPPLGPANPGSARAKYLALRPALANPIVPPIALSGTSTIGLHPALGYLNSLFAAGDLAVIRKVGLPAANLSHFKARDTMSRGRANLLTLDRRGWLGRLADAGLSNSLDIVGLGAGARSDFNANTATPMRISSLGDFALGTLGGSADSALRRDILQQMLSQTFPGEQRLTASGRPIFEDCHAFVATVQNAVAPITLTGTYPDPDSEPLGRSLADIAKLIKASLGTRVFYTVTSGFDTHGAQETQGAGNKPTLTARLTSVMQALQAFAADLQSASIDKWNDTAIVLFTEFGRRNYENQTGGTDHGHGFHAFVLGGAIQGGLKGTAVTGSDIDAASGYLPIEIDFRTLFKKSLEEWLQLSPSIVGQVFDDFTPSPAEPAFSLF